MTIKQYINKLVEFRNNLPRLVLQFMESKAPEIRGTVVGRVVGEGKSANGSNFSTYTSNWKQKRQKAGKTIAVKNFSLDGTMFGSFQLDKSKSRATPSTASITLGFGAGKQNTKSDGHTEKERQRGVLSSDQNIVDLSKDEEDRLNKEVNEFVIKLIRTSGL